MNNRYNTAPSEGHTSANEILNNVREIPVMRRTEPSTHLYANKAYTPAAQSDIRKTLAQFGLQLRSAA